MDGVDIIEKFRNIPCLSVAEPQMRYQPLGHNKKPIMAEGLYHIKFHVLF